MIDASALALALVHGKIGAVQQLARRAPVLGRARDPDSAADLDPGAIEEDRLAQAADDLGGQARGKIGAGPIGDDAGELVAAHAGHRPLRPDDRGDARRGLDQHGIAGDMAMNVVDRLEQIEIDEEHGAFGRDILDGLDRRLEILGQHAPVGQARQRIVAGEHGRLFFGGFAPPHFAAQVAAAAKQQDQGREAAEHQDDDEFVELPGVMALDEFRQRLERIEIDAHERDQQGAGEISASSKFLTRLDIPGKRHMRRPP